MWFWSSVMQKRISSLLFPLSRSQNDITKQRNFSFEPFILKVSLPRYSSHELERLLASLIGVDITWPFLSFEPSKLRARRKIDIMSQMQLRQVLVFQCCSPSESMRCFLSWQLPLGQLYHISSTQYRLPSLAPLRKYIGERSGLQYDNRVSRMVKYLSSLELPRVIRYDFHASLPSNLVILVSICAAPTLTHINCQLKYRSYSRLSPLLKAVFSIPH